MDSLEHLNTVLCSAYVNQKVHNMVAQHWGAFTFMLNTKIKDIEEFHKWTSVKLHFM